MKDRRHFTEVMNKVHLLNIKANRKRGRENEDRVKNALDNLLGGDCVNSFWKACFDEDRQGIDYWVELCNGIILPIQVKSSEKFADSFRNNHPDIRVIVVEETDNEELLKNKIVTLLKSNSRKN